LSGGHTRHLPPGAATRHLKWDDDWIDDGGRRQWHPLVTAIRASAIQDSAFQPSAAGTRRPAAETRTAETWRA